MIDPCPCNGCTESFLSCSDRCPKDARGELGYKAWKRQHLAEQKHLEANKNRYQPLWSAAREKAYRDNTSFGGYVRKTGGMQ